MYCTFNYNSVCQIMCVHSTCIVYIELLKLFVLGLCMIIIMIDII